MKLKVGYLSLVLLVVAALSGCASENTGADTPPNNTPPPPVVLQDPPLPADTVELKVRSTSVLSDYAQVPLNNPSRVTMKVALYHVKDGHYAGDIEIMFNDSGEDHHGYFSTEGEYEQNFWQTVGSSSQFRSILQDEVGALAFIIDETLDLGDGQKGETASGSVWYKNVGYTGAPPPEKYCWEISMGPYDCRASFAGNPLYPQAKNDSDSSFYPTEYKKLGTFTGLNLKESLVK